MDTSTAPVASTRTARFDFSGQDDDAALYSGQNVTVVRQLDPNSPADNLDAEVGPMFRVRAADGHEFDAFGDELTFADAVSDAEEAR